MSNTPFRALVLAPTLRDGQVTSRILQEQGIDTLSCNDELSLNAALAGDVDVVIATDDVPKRPSLFAALTSGLGNQPAWSELPVVVLAKDGQVIVDNVRSIPGSIVLERPVKIRTFISSLQAALAARKRQYQIRDQLEIIRKANDELQRSSIFAQQLLAIVSHDLRNPLTAIQHSAQLLLRSQDEKVKRVAPMLKRSADHATGLISDLLDFSQARMGGGIPIKPQQLEVNELLEDVISTMERSDPDRHIRLVPSTVSTAYWDYERLHQALVNLVANAIKHSPESSSITVACEATDSDIIIQVINLNRAGPIPLDIRHTLFEPFKRFAVDGVNSKGSIGLGLYIVHQIASGHNGGIEVESDQVQTCFRLTFPHGVRAPSDARL